MYFMDLCPGNYNIRRTDKNTTSLQYIAKTFAIPCFSSNFPSNIHKCIDVGHFFVCAAKENKITIYEVYTQSRVFGLKCWVSEP